MVSVDEPCYTTHMNTTIQHIHARQILDSRGNPTVEVDFHLQDGTMGRAAVPSGASTGSHEALELRDGTEDWHGKGVSKAVNHVNTTIASELKGKVLPDQRTLDELLLNLDGTALKSNLGANAILGVSMAAARARALHDNEGLYLSLAKQFNQPAPTLLPTPMMNVINGGEHADNGLAFQECMIIPTGIDSFSKAIQAGSEIFHNLKKLLQQAGYTTAVGDEGGFAPNVKDAKEAFDFLIKAIDVSGYTGKVQLGIDAAASEFYKDSIYTVDGKQLQSSELTAYYQELAKTYPLISIEDSHDEDDWSGFSSLTSLLGDTHQLVGDDLLVTNVKRIIEAQEKQACNAVLVKVNQIGSVSEAVDAIELAKKYGWNNVISHRSGETEDVFIAHLAVALGAGQIKTGSLSRTDRVCKYNELLRIEEELGEKATYQGKIRD